MENLGNTFLMVTDPYDFDMKQQKVFYSDFGFVITSQSEFFRDSMIKLCKECNNVRKRNFGKNIITTARKRMKKFINKQIKTERDLFELVAMLFDIVYYTAVSQDKNAHLRKFSVIEGATLKYFGYIGSKDYDMFEIINKIQEKIESSKDKNGAGSCFEVYQIKN
ncbi:hypothetical protein LCGC14_0663590 [marine sediment metagenome]|uniref:Uncharacterized protein n=1 Tax=marine sediment metagenome TaxID=412755 RepID=A0A0F9TE94_9ZZZZ